MCSKIWGGNVLIDGEKYDGDVELTQFEDFSITSYTDLNSAVGKGGYTFKGYNYMTPNSDSGTSGGSYLYNIYRYKTGSSPKTELAVTISSSYAFYGNLELFVFNDELYIVYISNSYSGSTWYYYLIIRKFNETGNGFSGGAEITLPTGYSLESSVVYNNKVYLFMKEGTIYIFDGKTVTLNSTLSLLKNSSGYNKSATVFNNKILITNNSYLYSYDGTTLTNIGQSITGLSTEFLFAKGKKIHAISKYNSSMNKYFLYDGDIKTDISSVKSFTNTYYCYNIHSFADGIYGVYYYNNRRILNFYKNFYCLN